MSFSLLILLFQSLFFPIKDYKFSFTSQSLEYNLDKINHAKLNNDTIYISGNMNVEDSLNLLNGYIILDGDLDINRNGVLNISNNAFLLVKKDIHLNGSLYGSQNTKTEGKLNRYVDSQIFAKPIELTN